MGLDVLEDLPRLCEVLCVFWLMSGPVAPQCQRSSRFSVLVLAKVVVLQLENRLELVHFPVC